MEKVFQFKVQTEKAKASFKDGILEIRFAKTEEAKNDACCALKGIG